MAAVLAGPALALEAMDDGALAEQSGQAGGLTVSLTLPSSTLAVSSIGLTDTNGITDTLGSHTHLGKDFSASAALFYAPTTFSKTAAGVSLCSNASGACTATVNPITAVIDAGANATGTQTALQIAVNLPSDLQRIRVNPFSLYLSPQASGNIFNSSRTLNANVVKLLEVGANGIDVTFKAGTPVTMNVLFGRGLTSTQHMVEFTSGSLLHIGNDLAGTGTTPVKVFSKNDAGTQSSLSLDFDIAANSQSTGFSLAGFYVDLLSTGGVSFGKVGLTDKLDITLSNLVAGTATSQAVETFDNLKNASMGNIGLVGVQVTDLKIRTYGVTGF